VNVDDEELDFKDNSENKNDPNEDSSAARLSFSDQV